MATPVLLLHSSGLSGRQWRRLAVRLEKRGHRTLAPDFTGHGQSAPWPEPEPFSFRADVEQVVATLRGEPHHLVGHSYGGLVALHAALATPDAVRSLVLIEPVAFGVLDDDADADAKRELARVEVPWGETAPEHDHWLGGFVDFWGGAGAWQALREEGREEFRRVGWVLREGVRSLAADRTPLSAYRALTMPTQLVTGELSPLAARRVVQRLADTIPGAHVATIPGAGHMAPLSHSDLVNEVVYAALARTP